jgi:deoxyribodipyrimidine photo-lyase
MKYLYWMRNDLRTQDNEVLEWASHQGGEMLILYSLPSDFHEWSPHRRGFLKQTLDDLEKNLKNSNLNLHITSRSLENFLPELLQVQKLTHLLFSKEHAFNERREEQKIKQLAEGLGLRVEEFDQSSLIKETELAFSIPQLPKIFTEFKNTLGTTFKVSPLVELQKTDLIPLQIPKEKIDWREIAIHPWFEGGESKGLERIQAFIWESQSILHYNDTRNGMMNLNDSSKFSPWLALGAISARQIYHEVKKFELQHGENKSCYWLIYELLWRDYFKFYAKKYGARIFLADGIQQNPNKVFKNDEVAFKKWTMGETGEPFIDAHMKELLLTGWMSNRGRQNVSNYLAKTMNINWTWGANWFEKNLIDYDPCQNWGNWNYTSGVGADPRDRLFNPKSQAKAYDPDGIYQQKWLGQRKDHE